MDIPQWHEASFDSRDLVSIADVNDMAAFMRPATLRSYATGRRTHRIYGPMPPPVCRVSNRKLWLRADIEWWLVLHIPRHRHSRKTVKHAQRDTMRSWQITPD